MRCFQQKHVINNLELIHLIGRAITENVRRNRTTTTSEIQRNFSQKRSLTCYKQSNVLREGEQCHCQVRAPVS